MKQIMVVITTILVLVFLTPDGAPHAASAPSASNPPGNPVQTGWEKKWNDTLAAAKKEGVVLVYANVLPETRATVPAAFQKKYGIKADFLLGTGAQLGTRFVTEFQSGTPVADILILGATTLIINVKPLKALQPIEPLLILPEVKDKKKWYGEKIPYVDVDTQALGFLTLYNGALMRNTETVKAGDVTSFLDLLKPQWKGKVSMFDPSIAGSGAVGLATLAESIGYDKAMDYLATMIKQQEAVIVRDKRVQMESVARGKYAIALWPSADVVDQFIKLRSPVASVRTKEGGYVTSSGGGVGVSAKPSNPNAAVVFTNWLLSQEGQSIFSKSFQTRSARTDVTLEGILPDFLIPPGVKPYWEAEEGLLSRGKLMEDAARIVSGAGSK